MNNKPQTAGILPYARTSQGLAFFMQMRPKTARLLAGKFGIFGGYVEEGETPLQAVAREAWEELELSVDEPALLDHFDLPEVGLHVYLWEVKESFADETKVLEGEYGQFIFAHEIETNDLVTEDNKRILRAASKRLNGERRQTAGLAAFYKENAETYVYMQMRDANAKYNAHTFGLFGGGVEDGESLEQALRREIQEELGIEIGDAKHFKHFDGTIADCDVFILEVERTFGEGITPTEGEYGAFIALSSRREQPIADFSLAILDDIAEYLSA